MRQRQLNVIDRYNAKTVAARAAWRVFHERGYSDLHPSLLEQALDVTSDGMLRERHGAFGWIWATGADPDTVDLAWLAAEAAVSEYVKTVKPR